MMTDLELKDLIIDSVIVDKQGLYEIFWEIPDGNVYDDEFGYNKERGWDSVSNILIELVEDNLVNLIFGNYKNGEIVKTGARELLKDKKNWIPFDIIEGRGFLLTKGDELKRRLDLGVSTRQRP